MSSKNGEKVTKTTKNNEKVAVDGKETANKKQTAEDLADGFGEEVISITNEPPIKTEAEEYKDMAQRVQAEFNNYRRRNNEAVLQSRIDATDDIISEFFTVLDNLERGIKSVKDEQAKNGMELIYKQILSIMEKHEVAEMVALDTEFDPQAHHAVAQSEDGENAGKVVEVYVKGYARGKKVLRPAMVKVAK